MRHSEWNRVEFLRLYPCGGMNPDLRSFYFPVAILISEDVQEKTLEQFLVATKKKIEERAKEIVGALLSHTC